MFISRQGSCIDGSIPDAGGLDRTTSIGIPDGGVLDVGDDRTACIQPIRAAGDDDVEGTLPDRANLREPVSDVSSIGVLPISQDLGPRTLTSDSVNGAPISCTIFIRSGVKPMPDAAGVKLEHFLRPVKDPRRVTEIRMFLSPDITEVAGQGTSSLPSVGVEKDPVNSRIDCFPDLLDRFRQRYSRVPKLLEPTLGITRRG